MLRITGCTAGGGDHRPTRPPGGQRGEPLAEADVSDVPLLLVDGSNLLFRAYYVL